MTAHETLDSIKAQFADTTPGQWQAWDRGIGYEVHSEHGEPINTGCRETFTKGDAEFIASAPATVTRLTTALEAVLAVADDLETRGTSLEEQGNNGSIYSTRAEGRGLGYLEGRRLIRAAIENALKETP